MSSPCLGLVAEELLACVCFARDGMFPQNIRWLGALHEYYAIEHMYRPSTNQAMAYSEDVDTRH